MIAAAVPRRSPTSLSSSSILFSIGTNAGGLSASRSAFVVGGAYVTVCFRGMRARPAGPKFLGLVDVHFGPQTDIPLHGRNWEPREDGCVALIHLSRIYSRSAAVVGVLALALVSRGGRHKVFEHEALARVLKQAGSEESTDAYH